MRLSPSRLALAGLAAPLLLATAGIAGASWAQPASPPAARDQAGHRGEWADPAKRAERAEMRAQRLREVLQLRPDQEPALQAFLASHKAPDGAGGRWREERQAAQSMTTPQRMDRMLAHLDEARTRMAARADAVKRFYAALSPSQQKAFDALHADGGMGRGGMGHGGMGGMGRGGGHHRGGPGGHGMDGPPMDAPGEP